jgi:putative transcriptional regulator
MPMKSHILSRLDGRSYLDGQCLIAMPGMTDQRFSRTVVYLCAHSEEGAMGLVLNRPATDTTISELLVQLKVVPEDERILLPQIALQTKVLRGGPVEIARGFVLHTHDCFLDSSLPVDSGVCLTATLDILRAIAKGEGPSKALLALGYAGWSAGQLEKEIQENAWLNCPADAELVFNSASEDLYSRAVSRLGIDLGRLSGSAGHA